MSHIVRLTFLVVFYNCLKTSNAQTIANMLIDVASEITGAGSSNLQTVGTGHVTATAKIPCSTNPNMLIDPSRALENQAKFDYLNGTQNLWSLQKLKTNSVHYKHKETQFTFKLEIHVVCPSGTKYAAPSIRDSSAISTDAMCSDCRVIYSRNTNNKNNYFNAFLSSNNTRVSSLTPWGTKMSQLESELLSFASLMYIKSKLDTTHCQHNTSPVFITNGQSNPKKGTFKSGPANSPWTKQSVTTPKCNKNIIASSDFNMLLDIDSLDFSTATSGLDIQITCDGTQMLSQHVRQNGVLESDANKRFCPLLCEHHDLKIELTPPNSNPPRSGRTSSMPKGMALKWFAIDPITTTNIKEKHFIIARSIQRSLADVSDCIDLTTYTAPTPINDNRRSGSIESTSQRKHHQFSSLIKRRQHVRSRHASTRLLHSIVSWNDLIKKKTLGRRSETGQCAAETYYTNIGNDESFYGAMEEGYTNLAEGQTCGNNAAQCEKYEQCYVDVCTQTCSTCDMNKLNQYETSAPSAWCNGDESNCYQSSLSNGQTCRDISASSCNAYSDCELNPCSHTCDPYYLVPGSDFSCDSAVDELYDNAETGAYCNGDTSNCFTQSIPAASNHLSASQFCEQQSINQCEMYSSCQVQIDESQSSCDVQCKAYVEEESTCVQDCVLGLSSNSALNMDQKTQTCTKVCNVQESTSTLKKTLEEMKAHMQDASFINKASSMQQRADEVTAYLLPYLTSGSGHNKDSNYRSLIQIDQERIAKSACTPLDEIDIAFGSLPNSEDSTLETALATMKSAHQCHENVITSVSTKVLQYGKTSWLGNKTKASLDRAAASYSKMGWQSDGVLPFFFCYQSTNENRRYENFGLHTENVQNVASADSSTIISNKCPTGSEAYYTFYDASAGVSNLIEMLKDRKNAFVLTPGTLKTMSENSYSICTDKWKNLIPGCDASGSQIGGRRLLSTNTNVETRSSVQASVPIERVEARGCPTGSTRRPRTTNTTHACWNAYETNQYFSSESAMTGKCTISSTKCTNGETFKQCPNGLVIGVGSEDCPSSQYTYKLSNEGNGGFIQYTSVCIPTNPISTVTQATYAASDIANLIKDQSSPCCTIKTAYALLLKNGKTCCQSATNCA